MFISGVNIPSGTASLKFARQRHRWNNCVSYWARWWGAFEHCSSGRSISLSGRGSMFRAKSGDGSTGTGLGLVCAPSRAAVD